MTVVNIKNITEDEVEEEEEYYDDDNDDDDDDDDEEGGVERRKKVPKVRPHIVIGAPVEGRGIKSKAESEERRVTNHLDNHI